MVYLEQYRFYEMIRVCCDMKILIVLCALLLAGCGAEREILSLQETEVVEVTEMTMPKETVPVTEPAFQRELLHPLVNPKDEDFVRVKDYIPDIVTELKYATPDNFTGQVIYEFGDVFLRYGTVMKLKAASEELNSQGLHLKIWDGFRPVSAQFKLWEICPDDTYVADPNVGYSNHSRGFAVDLTLVDGDGNELLMPTGFDDFALGADRDYSDCDSQAAGNARYLEAVMEKHGFSGYWGEWWHYNDTRKYDVEDSFDPAVIARCAVNRNVILLERFWDPTTVILEIPEGECVTRLGYREEYILAEYWGYRGYLPTDALVQD